MILLASGTSKINVCIEKKFNRPMTISLLKRNVCTKLRRRVPSNLLASAMSPKPYS